MPISPTDQISGRISEGLPIATNYLVFYFITSVAGKTTDQIIEDIIEHEKVKTGIDWKAAAAAGPTEWKTATEKAHSYLNGLKDKLTEAEKEKAKQMGLLNAQGMK